MGLGLPKALVYAPFILLGTLASVRTVYLPTLGVLGGRDDGGIRSYSSTTAALSPCPTRFFSVWMGWTRLPPATAVAVSYAGGGVWSSRFEILVSPSFSTVGEGAKGVL